MKVACLLHHGNRRYTVIAEAMAAGIRACGDKAVVGYPSKVPDADAAVMYGWKMSAHIRRYPQYVYADMGFWKRDSYYRMTANGWGPEKYVHQGMPSDRFRSFIPQILPWHDGEEILIAGSSRKSATEHGFGYMQFETMMAQELLSRGLKVTYRPKPTDSERRPIPGCGFDEGELAHSLARCKAVVTHHSNLAVEALVAGVPVHCVTGAAAAFSVKMDEIADPPKLAGREQFLADVAWLQWSVAEIRSGAYWSYAKERGIVC